MTHRFAAVLMTAAVAMAGCTADNVNRDPATSATTKSAGSTTQSAPSRPPVLRECPTLVLQWASTVFVNPRLEVTSVPPTIPGDPLGCIVAVADFRGLSARGNASLSFALPDPTTEVHPGEALRDAAARRANNLLHLDCVNTSVASATFGAVTEYSCTKTDHSEFTTAFAVANDRAAASAVVVYNATTAPDPATRAYLAATTRTAAYAALGTL